MSAHLRSYAGLDKRRVENLTDGIFATVMTILGLSLSVPYILGAGQTPRLTINFYYLATGIVVYAMSFVFLGVYWVGHHIAFEYLRMTDRIFIWLNNMFLLCIGLLPLTTALLGDDFLDPIRLIIYGINLIAIGFSLYATFRHATVGHHLVNEDLNPEVIRRGARRILMGPSIATAAILLTLVTPIAGLLVFAAMPVPFIFPGRIDSLLQWVERV
jgi:uncharacterized membrane protein